MILRPRNLRAKQAHLKATAQLHMAGPPLEDEDEDLDIEVGNRRISENALFHTVIAMSVGHCAERNPSRSGCEAGGKLQA